MLFYFCLFLVFSFTQVDALCLGTGGFTGETLVKVPGGYKAIQDVKKGDKVLSKGFNGILIEKEVTEIFEQEPPKLMSRMLAGILPGVIPGRLCRIETDKEVINVSPEHLFFNLTNQKVVQARYLSKNSHLRSSSDKDVIQLNKIKRINPKEKVYNLSVEGSYNFFVTKSDIWVCSLTPVQLLSLKQ